MTTESSDQGKTEADDVEKLNDALLTATWRRAKYPNKAAKMLEKTLETNSEILKVSICFSLVIPRRNHLFFAQYLTGSPKYEIV